MKKLLIVLGGGGHTEQMLRLVSVLGKRYSYEYVMAKDDDLSENKINYKGRIFKLTDPRKKEDKSLIKVFLKYIPSSMQAIFMLFRSKADAIIACGPGLSVHICILGKIFFRKKIVFLESWSRVYSKSMAGKFVYPFSDLFFVQWKENKNYEKAVYAGRLG